MPDQNEKLVVLPEVRISFPHLEKLHTAPGGASDSACYSAEFLLDPTVHSSVAAEITAKVQKFANEKWADMAPAILQQIQQDTKNLDFGFGNTRVNKKTMEVLDGYYNMYYLRSRSKQRPKLINTQGVEINLDNALDQSKRPYGGCFVNALIDIWCQDNQHGRNVRYGLIAVQFAKDGPAFGRPEVETNQFFQPIPGAVEPPQQQWPNQQPQQQWPNQQQPIKTKTGEFW